MMIKVTLKLTSQVLLLACVIPQLLYADSQDSIWIEVAQSLDLDPRLIYSIALTESKKLNDDKLTVSPWPWALNTKKYGGQYFNSYEEALTTLTRYVEEEGIQSVDIGLMQINWRYNGHYLPNLAELLKPENNIRVSALVLYENLLRTRDRRQAIALYNSSDPIIGRAYAKRVLEIYEGLKKIPFIEGVTP